MLCQIQIPLLQQNQHRIINNVIPPLLKLRETVDVRAQSRINRQQKLVESAPDAVARERVVIDQRGPQIRDVSGTQVAAGLVNVTGDQEVQDGVAQELQPLVAVGGAVADVGRVRQRLQEVGAVAEVVAEVFLQNLPVGNVEVDVFSRGVLVYDRIRRGRV